MDLNKACWSLVNFLRQFARAQKCTDKCILMLEHLELEFTQGLQDKSSLVLAPCFVILRQAKKDIEKIDQQKSIDVSILEQIIMQACQSCLAELRGKDSQFAVALNSPHFYQQEIAKYEQMLGALRQEIEDLRQHRAQDHRLTKEKEQYLRELSRRLEEYKKKEVQVRAREDARQTWKEKIERAFDVLRGNQSRKAERNDVKEGDSEAKVGRRKKADDPIQVERKRLCELYWIYNGLSAIMVVVLVVAEIGICVKLACVDGMPVWHEYLFLVVPIPIAVGLLWGFITQANRAQRQRVVLSKLLHDIRYIEAIMLAMNELSLDVESSVQRINLALDKLLERYLMSGTYGVEEVSLKNEEKKDAVPYDLLISVINELRKRG